jgi:hypothetical protein
VALVEYQERAPDNRDRDLPVKLLTRRARHCARLALIDKLRLAIHQTLIMPLASICG